MKRQELLEKISFSVEFIRKIICDNYPNDPNSSNVKQLVQHVSELNRLYKLYKTNHFCPQNKLEARLNKQLKELNEMFYKNLLSCKMSGSRSIFGKIN